MRKVILAGVQLKSEKVEFDSVFQECKELCRACNMEVVGEIVQSSHSFDPRSAFRSGKVEELVTMCHELQAECVVFANQLTVAAGERLSRATGVEVLDRTALILDIFSSRARTRQARIQVETARLQYALPRIAFQDESQDHARGGSFHSRGSGEMRSAEIARKYRGRIKELKNQLKEIEKSGEVAERRRGKSTLGRVAFVGYTNAGKSSLMNATLQYTNRNSDHVFEKDMLFATLDTSVRNLKYKNQEFLLYDTVGFVSNLPQELIDAFHSTLAAARNADLLIHVIDASDPLWEKKAEITLSTLVQIGAQDVPVLRVYNKMDLVTDPKQFMGICTSTLEGTGIEELMNQIITHLYPREHSVTCLIPYDKMALVEEGRKTLHIEILEDNEFGQRILIQGEEVRMKPFKMYEERK